MAPIQVSLAFFIILASIAGILKGILYGGKGMFAVCPRVLRTKAGWVAVPGHAAGWVKTKEKAVVTCQGLAKCC